MRLFASAFDEHNLEGPALRSQGNAGPSFVSGFAKEEEAEVVEQCANSFGVVGVSPAAQVDEDLKPWPKQPSRS